MGHALHPEKGHNCEVFRNTMCRCMQLFLSFILIPWIRSAAECPGGHQANFGPDICDCKQPRSVALPQCLVGEVCFADPISGDPYCAHKRAAESPGEKLMIFSSKCNSG